MSDNENVFELTRESRDSNFDWPTWMHVAWNKEATESNAVLVHEGDSLVVNTAEGPTICDLGESIVFGDDGNLKVLNSWGREKMSTGSKLNESVLYFTLETWQQNFIRKIAIFPPKVKVKLLDITPDTHDSFGGTLLFNINDTFRLIISVDSDDKIHVDFFTIRKSKKLDFNVMTSFTFLDESMLNTKEADKIVSKIKTLITLVD